MKDKKAPTHRESLVCMISVYGVWVIVIKWKINLTNFYMGHASILHAVRLGGLRRTKVIKYDTSLYRRERRKN